ncbi:DnaT-like ssDNA-binding domain-containing protein [SAR86 cluster bacterium]|jgi:hypothetical protein|nr:DnaT-like ssDNA-binding domain-containing protein [SAR86 cluster bacterium]
MTEKYKDINFSSEIADSIGLEEAIIYSILEKISSNQLTLSELDQKLSFLNIQRKFDAISKLEKLGLVIKDDLSLSLKNKLKVKNDIPIVKNPTFDFSEETINQAKSFGMSNQFIREKIIYFKSFPSNEVDSEYNSNYKLLKFLIKEWRKYEKEEVVESKKTLIKKDWEPSVDGLSILESASIEIDFVVKSIPEFILYWQEKKMKSDTWNSLFINHVRRQWARYKNIIEDNVSPKKMAADWYPHANCFDVLKLARIEEEFAKNQLPEFKIYWIDSNQVMMSWNSKFIQHVKYKWFKENPKASGIISRLTDKEWAIEYSD